MSRLVRHVVVACGVLSLAACQQPARTDGMAATPLPLSAAAKRTFDHGIVLGSVSAGKAIDIKAGTTAVDDGAFAAALGETLAGTGLGAGDGGAAAYRLDAQLIDVKRGRAIYYTPMSSTIKYRLTAADSGAVVYDEVITADFAATMGDALWGATRTRLATEGAIRENFKAFLERLDERTPD